MKNLFMPYTKSGITIDLPNDVEFFCFENCDGYRMLSGNHFKEMDIGWYEPAEDILYLIELKDFTKKNLRDRDIAKQVVLDLVKKSVDSMAMIMAIKAGILCTVTNCAFADLLVGNFILKNAICGGRQYIDI